MKQSSSNSIAHVHTSSAMRGSGISFDISAEQENFQYEELLRNARVSQGALQSSELRRFLVVLLLLEIKKTHPLLESDLLSFCCYNFCFKTRDLLAPSAEALLFFLAMSPSRTGCEID